MNNDILYSPWRIDYILSNKDNKCIFCLKPNENNDQENLILFRSKTCFVIMNRYPYNNGHLLIVPFRHVSKLNDLNAEEISDLFETVRFCEKVVENLYHCDGINIGMNLGKAAGAGIDDHLHVHLLPRWNGDSNFMTTIGATRILPESFENAYLKLKQAFDRKEK